MNCSTCDKPVDPRSPGVLRQVMGWASQRSQGGQNHVIGRQETGALMCPECATRLRHRLPLQQRGLF